MNYYNPYGDAHIGKTVERNETELSLEQLLGMPVHVSEDVMDMPAEYHVPLTEKLVRENPHTLWHKFPEFDGGR
jgi:hypothetical protein